MSITADQVKELRKHTGAGMMECKKALLETKGDFEKAIEYLRKRGLAAAAKKAGRETLEGRIGSYIHSNGKLGVLVEISCETDFVAKTEEFNNFLKDIAMHIAASDPICVSEDEVSQKYIEKEKEIITAQIKEDPKYSDKPSEMINKIIDGKLNRIYKEQVLLNQSYVKNTEITVADHLKATIGSLGENMQIRRFSRMTLGEKP